MPFDTASFIHTVMGSRFAIALCCLCVTRQVLGEFEITVGSKTIRASGFMAICLLLNALKFAKSMIKYDANCEKVHPLSDIERLTITLPADMAATVKGAVEGGNYASSSEVIREALRDWKMKHALQLRELAALKADIDKGLRDVAEGRIKDFDTDRIIKRGKTLLRGRSPSA